MKVLEFNEEDYRELQLEEEEMVHYEVDKKRIETLVHFLGYQMKTDGERVYAVGNGDVIEVGSLK